jgi:hypothetical protein
LYLRRIPDDLEITQAGAYQEPTNFVRVRMSLKAAVELRDLRKIVQE